MQEDLAGSEVEGQSGAGLVKVKLNGKFEARGVKIDPSLLKPEDAEMLEDLILAAFQDAKGKAEAAVQTQDAGGHRRPDAAPGPQAVLGSLPLPVLRGEGRGEGQPTLEQVSAPHPSPLPMRRGMGRGDGELSWQESAGTEIERLIAAAGAAAGARASLGAQGGADPAQAAHRPAGAAGGRPRPTRPPRSSSARPAATSIP